MKKIIILLLCVVFHQSTILNAQDIEPDEFNGTGCEDWFSYVPYPSAYTPIRYLGITLHIFQNSSGEENFRDIAEHRAHFDKIIDEVNRKFSELLPMNLPTSSMYIKDSRVRFILDGVYFHRDDTVYNYRIPESGMGPGSSIKRDQIFNKYVLNNPAVPNKFTSIHIFSTEPSIRQNVGLAININYPQRCILINSAYRYYTDGGGADYWSTGRLITHELGHILGLRHTWCGNDYCDDTPKNINCYHIGADPNTGYNDCSDEDNCDTASNNIMDYNAYRDALTECQLGRIHYYLMKEDGYNYNLVKRDYCSRIEDMYIRSGGVIWNHAVNLKGNLYIKSGSSLTIKCKVSLPRDAHIIVEQGATLTIDGGTVTNSCGEFWKGIIVEGLNCHYLRSGTASNYEMLGKLIIKNTGKVEFAETGVYAYGNGIVRINNGIFSNCRTGLELRNYDNGQWENHDFYDGRLPAEVFYSKFITDIDYPFRDGGALIPQDHMNLQYVDHISLLCNTFSNIIPSPLIDFDKRGTGIYAYNSNVYIGGINDRVTQTEFNGLSNCIQVRNTTANSVKIEKCKFNDYYKKGVYLVSSTAPVVISNDFNSIHGEVALYLEDCSNYHVEDNYFEIINNGIIVSNSSNYANKVYRNKFEETEYAMSAYRNNSNTDGSLGLSVSCNKFQKNSYHIFIAEGDIKKEQGNRSTIDDNLSYPAGNQFNYLYFGRENVFRTLRTGLDYLYYKCNGYNDPTSISTAGVSGNVTIIGIGMAFDELKFCPSGLPVPEAPIYPDDLLRTAQQISYSISDNIVSLNSVVDGGNTEELTGTITRADYNTFAKISGNLIKLSPYLSDTVLLLYMRKQITGFDSIRTSVLIANSPLPNRILKELENMQLPDIFKERIKAKQTGENLYTLKKQEIEQLMFEKDITINKLIQTWIWQDTVSSSDDDLINYMVKNKDHESKYLSVPLLIKKGRFDEARGQLEELGIVSKDLPEKVRTETETFSWLYDIIIRTDTISDYNNYKNEILKNYKELSSLADDYSLRFSSRARTILNKAGLSRYEPEIIMSGKERSVKMLPDQIWENINEEQTNNYINVFPNPASNEIKIEYNILGDNNNLSVEIFDINGTKMFSYKLNNNCGTENINISVLPDGIYILNIGNYSKIISIVK